MRDLDGVRVALLGGWNLYVLLSPITAPSTQMEGFLKGVGGCPGEPVRWQWTFLTSPGHLPEAGVARTDPDDDQRMPVGGLDQEHGGARHTRRAAHPGAPVALACSTARAPNAAEARPPPGRTRPWRGCTTLGPVTRRAGRRHAPLAVGPRNPLSPPVSAATTPPECDCGGAVVHETGGAEGSGIRRGGPDQRKLNVVLIDTGFGQRKPPWCSGTSVVAA